MERVKVSLGVEREILAIGEQLMLVEFAFEQGGVIDWHIHVHEQAGYVSKGKLRLLVADQEFILTEGMSSVVPSNVRHKAIALEDTVYINAFSPIREDYLLSNE